MIVCPVCEHAQTAGTECEVCGKVLASAAATPPPPPPDAIEGLERTALGAAVAEGGVARMPELESTLHAPAAPAAPERVPDLEATGTGAVDVEVAPAEEIERTEHADLPVEDAFALPALPVCRYCRTPATADERICARCGMRLPAAPARVAAERGAAEHRCSCGLLLPPGATRCPSCGARAF